MNDPLLVGGGESLRDLDRVVDGELLRERAGVEPVAQRLARKQLHDRVRNAVRRVPKSWIARMFGCESAATAFASRSKRASMSGFAATVSGRTLTATSRSSFESFARYTSPIPPAPIGARIS